jgi:molecular chaperone GrpE
MIDPDMTRPDMTHPDMTHPDMTHETSSAQADLPDSQAHATPEPSPQERIEQLDAALQEMKDKWLRAEADMANLRARTRREIDDARQYSIQKFARDVVEAAENINRGIESLPKREPGEPDIVTKLREGFEGIERSFIGLLERNGIERQDPTGSLFDANFHQAMAEEDSADHPAGTIVKAWSHTWLLNGRLLRPGMVVVAKGGPAPTARVDATA